MNSPTDLVVVLPGILGSTLRRGRQDIWAPSAGALLNAIKTFGRSLRSLQLPEGIGDDHPGDGVAPAALMPDLHAIPGIWTPIKGYDRLVSRLKSLGYREGENLILFPYDWRLSNRYNGRRLATIVEPALQRWRERHADAKVSFVCHSMGGLVARWYIERCGGAEVTHKLITLGTPYRGAAKALEQLVNGVPKGIGPLGIDLTLLIRGMPSMYQLIPEYACIELDDDLAKTTETQVPELKSKLLADGMLFHTQLAEAASHAAPTHAIIGFRQSTPTTVRLADHRAELMDTYRGDNLHGDSTVPMVGACSADIPMDSPLLRRVADRHGNLQRNRAALDELEGILTAKEIRVRAPDTVDLDVRVPELIFAGDALRIRVTAADGGKHALRIVVTNESGQTVDSRTPLPATETTITVEDPPPGAYAVTVSGLRDSSPISAVSADVIVWN